MPLVRLSYMQGKPDGFGQHVGDIVYQTMVETLNVPPKDRFQVLTTHTKDNMIYDPDYLDIPRTDGVIFLQITLNEGRSVAVKQAFYATRVERLHTTLGVRQEDVFINLVEVKKENWSFGNGIAQYAE